VKVQINSFLNRH